LTEHTYKEKKNHFTTFLSIYAYTYVLEKDLKIFGAGFDWNSTIKTLFDSLRGSKAFCF